MSKTRLQKYLAECGVGSRRKCEDLIRGGSVRVNGVPATLGMSVDSDKDVVELSGRRVARERKAYVMLHKPRGFICSRSDPEGRPTVYELINGEGAPAERLYTIGRLDFDSEGLILLTNDGEFANRLAHPRHEMSKTYLAWVDEDLSPDDIDALKRGVTNEGERLRLASIQRETGRGAGKPCYRVVLREGKNRQVRRMFDAVGHRVTRLVRVKVGPLELGRLRVGKWRKLLNEEVRALRG